LKLAPLQKKAKKAKKVRESSYRWIDPITAPELCILHCAVSPLLHARLALTENQTLVIWSNGCGMYMHNTVMIIIREIVCRSTFLMVLL